MANCVRNSLLLGLGAALVSACSGGSSGATLTTNAPSTGPDVGFRAPEVMREQGLGSVIGKGASLLEARFGAPRIDLSEGDARKLQFISQGCVLDIYLYPLSNNAAPVATHVEARQRNGGGDANRADCIKAVEQAGNGG